MSNSFEILAIITKKIPELGKEANDFKTLMGLEPLKYYNYLKVLKGDTVFTLNRNYDISSEKEKIVIKRKSNYLSNIFSNGKPNIQVNAIVGKNGSGKSTLSEILYLMLYNLAIHNGLIYGEDEIKVTDYKGFLNASLLLKIDNKFHCVDFELLNYYIYKHAQKQDSKNIRFFSVDINADETELKLNKESQSKFMALSNLFYLISINYSLYGLNEQKMGDWISHIFHKNDMYETPIVINPFRKAGNIDVNSEDLQNNARLLSNISNRHNQGGNTIFSDYMFHQLNIFFDNQSRKKAYLSSQLLDYLADNFNIKAPSQPKRTFKLSSRYNYKSFLKPENSLENEKETKIHLSIDDSLQIPVSDYASVLLLNSKEAFKIIHKYFYNLKSLHDISDIETNLTVSSDIDIIQDIFSYFICKLYRTGINYPKEFGNILNKNKDGFSSGNEFEYALNQCLISNSHACFKLKRVYFFLNFSKGKDLLKFAGKTENGSQYWTLNGLNSKIPAVLEYLDSNKVGKQIVDEPNYSNTNFFKIDQHFFKQNEISWRIPPPIFKTECIVASTNGLRHKVPLSILSSGETQFIYSLQTILYHIINLESNNHYRNIVLLLDEIELYNHPAYQKAFLSILLKQIQELNLVNIKFIQIIVLTHSPFILSDIPSSNVLRLEEGVPIIIDDETFAANIHEILAKDFFLKGSFTGNFAENYVKTLIKEINDKKIIKKEQVDTLKKKISIIGEVFIKQKLTEMVINKSDVGRPDKIQSIIEFKLEEIQKLKKEQDRFTKNDKDR